MWYAAVMQLTVSILALIFGIPSMCNAIVSLYDRFRAKPVTRPIFSVERTGRWTLRIFNFIGLALLIGVAATWFFPTTRAVAPPSPPAPPIARWSKADIERLDAELPKLGTIIARVPGYYDEVREIAENGPRKITVTMTPQSAAAEATNLQTRIEGNLRGPLTAFLKDNNYDFKDLSPLVAGYGADSIIDDLHAYAAAVRMLPVNATATDVLKNEPLWQARVLLEDNSTLFLEWGNAAREAITKERTALAVARKSNP